MNDELLQEIRCPNCQSQIKLTGTGQSITCDACNSQFVLAGHLCPKCQTYHRNEIAFCGRCGTPMSRVSGRCQTNNWAGDEFCYHCGQAMDLIGGCLCSLSKRINPDFSAAKNLFSPKAGLP